MKKRSMLAIASLATGFVVAAVSPSHALGNDPKPHALGDDANVLGDGLKAHGIGDGLKPAILDSDQTLLGSLDPAIAKQYRLAMDNAPHTKQKGGIG